MDIKRGPPGGGDPPGRPDGLSHGRATPRIVTPFRGARGVSFVLQPERSIPAAGSIDGWSVRSRRISRRVRWFADESRARRYLAEAIERWRPCGCPWSMVPLREAA